MITERDDLPELQLTVQDRHSPLMLKLQAYLDARLGQYRRKNDSDLPPDQTAALRGRIGELKNLKNLLAAGDSQD